MYPPICFCDEWIHLYLPSALCTIFSFNLYFYEQGNRRLNKIKYFCKVTSERPHLCSEMLELWINPFSLSKSLQGCCWYFWLRILKRIIRYHRYWPFFIFFASCLFQALYLIFQFPELRNASGYPDQGTL